MSAPVRRFTRTSVNSWHSSSVGRSVSAVDNCVQSRVQPVETNVQERRTSRVIHTRSLLSTDSGTAHHQPVEQGDLDKRGLSTEFTGPTTTTKSVRYKNPFRVRVPAVCGYPLIWDSVGPLRITAQIPVEVR